METVERRTNLHKAAGTARRTWQLSLLVLALLVASIPAPAKAADASSRWPDIAGHWAEKILSAWAGQGRIGGYPDGTLRPDAAITRAEWMKLVNRLFGYAGSSDTAFADVRDGDWYAADVSAAVHAGYMNGYEDGTMRPDGPLSREEAAVMLSRLGKRSDNAAAAGRFSDPIAAWSRGSVGAAVAAGWMDGYPDGTFGPAKPMSRAEAIVVLDRLAEAGKLPEGGPKPTARIYDRAGTYGPASGSETIGGDVTIAKPDVTLRHTVVEGSLTIAESVGDGDVRLEGVAVKGVMTVLGGGENSIALTGTEAGTVEVDKPDGKVRLAAEGGSRIARTTLRSGAILEETDLEGTGFDDVQLADDMPGGPSVRLSGSFRQVRADASNVRLEVTKGRIETLVVGPSVKGLVVHLAAGVIVAKAVVHGEVSFTGPGTVLIKEGPAVSIEPSETSGDSDSGPGNGPEQPAPSTVKAVVKGELGRVLLHAERATVSRLQTGVSVPGIGSVTVSVYEPNGADWYLLDLAGAAYDTAYTLQFASGIVLADGLSPTVSWARPEDPVPPPTVRAIVKAELGRVLLHAERTTASLLQSGVSVPGIASVAVTVYEPNGADWYRLDLAGAAYDTAYTLQFADGIVLADGLSPTVSWARPVTVTELVYSPSSVLLSALGATADIQLNARLSDGTERPAAAEAVWTTGDGLVATVSGGVVQATGTGSTWVEASYAGFTVRVPVTVTLAAYGVAVSADTSPIAAGTPRTVRFVVKKSDGMTDTEFNGTRTIAVSGLQPAPDGSYGSWGGVPATSAAVQTDAVFTGGEADVALILNGAAAQTVTFSVYGVVQPAGQLAYPVTTAAPAKLAIQTQPSGGVDGKPLSTQPVVRIVDAYGNPTTAAMAVSAAVASGSSTLTGTNTVNAANGVATFTNIGLNGVSPAVTLSFSASGLTGAVSDSFSVENRFSEGDGSSATPYIVTTASQLNDIRNYLSSHFKLGADIDLSGYASGSGWEPIGTYTAPFTGTFDGQDHTVTGLRIYRPGTSNVGLFGSIGLPAVVRNVKLEQANVTGSGNVGSLVGAFRGGTVENVSAKGTVNDNGNGFYTGGLIGRAYAGTVISRSYVDMNVNGFQAVGGLVGAIEGTVSESYAVGVVVSNASGLGGLVGENYGTVRQSYSRASVTGGSNNVGGLVGDNRGTIDETYAAGTVLTNSPNKGGLVGNNGGAVSLTKSYYDQQVAQQIDAGKGTPLTTIQMKDQASFAGWSFGSVWGINGNYPYLLWP
ncbi:S-layer homology domain-containing protein [Paenibacillus flagellatus]|nr:S-layer homology domain-containing protein [Paenibacillus flagellatus]